MQLRWFPAEHATRCGRGNRASTWTKKIVHVIKRENGWAVKKHGASRATKIYQSKKEAVKDAQRLKRKGHDLVIHHKDGSVQKWEESEKSN